jgi:hypothetical protein
MKKHFILLFSTFYCLSSLFAGNLKLSGKVGTYPIEMEIGSSGENTLSGKYNYKGKNTSLNLEGSVMQDVIYLEEDYKGSQTGTFYLEYRSDSLIGKWVHDDRWFPVELKIGEGDRTCLAYFGIPERSENCSDAINGTYLVENYFINEMWFEENRPNIEVGYNGGEAVLELVTEDSLKFLVEAICGPTYHYAYAQGTASKHPEEENTYVWSSEDGCEIIIVLGAKEVSMSANNSMDCGFGARAYLEHSFTKVSEELDFESEH